MKKEFIPYEQALALKELGFDEPCVAFYYGQLNRLEIGFNWLNESCKNSLLDEIISAPLYQQAFRWFRKKGYDSKVQKESEGLYFGFYCTGVTWIIVGSGSYEEAELKCLKKLIEIQQNDNR